MECQQCVEENKRCIAEKGYGYGYIGRNLMCRRHYNTHEPEQNNLSKWSDGQQYKRTKRTKHSQSQS